jgi:hypothetical protein
MNSNRNDKASEDILTGKGDPVPSKIPQSFPVQREPSYNGALLHDQLVSHEQQLRGYNGGTEKATNDGGASPMPHTGHKKLRRGRRSISVSEGQVTSGGDRKLHRKRSSYDLRDDFQKCGEPLKPPGPDGGQNNDDLEGRRRRSVTMTAAIPPNNKGLSSTEGG